MRIDIRTSGPPLTERLLSRVEEHVQAWRSRFPELRPELRVRLFQTAGRRGGSENGCLLRVQLGEPHGEVQAPGLAPELETALGAAFQRLERETCLRLGRPWREPRRRGPRRAARAPAPVH